MIVNVALKGAHVVVERGTGDGNGVEWRGMAVGMAQGEKRGTRDSDERSFEHENGKEGVGDGNVVTQR